MKVVILNIIEFLKSVTSRLEQAYDLTWGCSNLTKEFNEEVEIRKSIKSVLLNCMRIEIYLRKCLNKLEYLRKFILVNILLKRY